MSRKTLATDDRPPEVYRVLRSWLRGRRGKRRDFERYLVGEALRRPGAEADRRQRSRGVTKGLALVAAGLAAPAAFHLMGSGELSRQGFTFLIAAIVAAALSIWSWRRNRASTERDS